MGDRQEPLHASAGTEVQQFDRDDEGYLQWVATNADGFVLDVPRGSPEAMVLHRAGCPRIAGEEHQGAGWTVEAVKLCSGEKWRLDDWAAERHGAPPPRDPTCSPD